MPYSRGAASTHFLIRLTSVGALVGLVVTGCSSWRIPNTGMPGEKFAMITGRTDNSNNPTIADGAAVQELNPPTSGVLRIIRPSRSEQGVELATWQAGVVVLVPAYLVENKNHSAFSKDVAAALKLCAPDLGTYADVETWKQRSAPLSSGKVVVANQGFYQYVTYRLRWKTNVSDTGRGYRITDLKAESYGAVRAVPSVHALRTTIRLALVSVEAAEAVQAEVRFPIFTRNSVSATCDRGTLQVNGLIVAAPGSGWLRGANQPFNVTVQIAEETSL